MRIGVTGISGSLGSALIEYFADAHILVGASRDELKAEKVMAQHPNVRCMVIAAGLEDERALRRAYDGCEILIHAAALKRISGSVYAAQELIKTNVNGTATVLRVARDLGIRKVIFVSSDKAVAAENLYGASKFCAECLTVQENAFSYPKGTSCVVVRYGNVLGSRGSVVHIWRKQLKLGNDLTVTHEQMTRFVLTLDEAVSLIGIAIDQLQAGEILVPELPAARMKDLAHSILQEAGYPSKVSKVIHYSGLRPGGEKLTEALLSPEECSRTWQHASGHWVIAPSHQTWAAPVTRNPLALFNRPSYTSASTRHLTVDELVLLLKRVQEREPDA